MEVLTVGSPAPEVKGVRWFNSGLIERLESGQVYVVEFWATWCGPCRAGMPHLSQLSTKHAGRATIIGVNVFEQDQGSEACCQKVAAFIEKMGSSLIYPVLVDGPDQFMTEQWMRRAGRQGIPSAFLVDQKGTVAWIGHPMQGLDEAVDAVLEGKKPEASKENEENGQFRKRQEQFKPYIDAIQKGDYEAAIRAVDRLVKLDKSYESAAEQLRFQAAAAGGRDDLVRPHLQELWEKDGDSNSWQQLAFVLSMSPRLSLGSYRIGIKIVERGLNSASEEMDKYRPMSLDALAKVYFFAGDKQQAIELVKEAIAECDKSPDFGATFKANCEMTLEYFEGTG